MIPKVILLSLVLLGNAAFAQQPIPRTPEGRPDFQGVWSSRILFFAMERIAGATTLVVGDKEASSLIAAVIKRRDETTPINDPDVDFHLADRLPQVQGQWRTSVIVEPPDGKAPLTADVRKLIAETRSAGFLATSGDVEARPLAERCLRGPVAAPFAIISTNMLRQIVQTADHFVVSNEADMTEARIIGVSASRRPAALTSLVGDSVARWEGDELVIETTNARGDPVRSPAIFVRSEARVIERLRLLSADELLYRFTIEDPASYARPWMGEYSMKRSHERMFESACHEGNYALPAILNAGRMVEERRAAAAPKATPQ